VRRRPEAHTPQSFREADTSELEKRQSLRRGRARPDASELQNLQDPLPPSYLIIFKFKYLAIKRRITSAGLRLKRSVKANINMRIQTDMRIERGSTRMEGGMCCATSSEAAWGCAS
jgi:hypothetical protein